MNEIAEKLREEALSYKSHAWSRADGGQDFSLAAQSLDLAADEIDRLERELVSLRARDIAWGMERDELQEERDAALAREAECRKALSNLIERFERQIRASAKFIPRHTLTEHEAALRAAHSALQSQGECK